MAVEARRFSHDFPAAVMGGSLFLDDYAGCAPPRDTTVLGEFPHSDLAYNYGFVPRKRPRLAAAGCFAGTQRAGMTPTGMEALVTKMPVVDVAGRAAGSGAASTSGRGLVSWVHSQGVEIDAVVRLEAERMRVGLEDARRRHARALLADAAHAASTRLRAAEAEAQSALRRNAVLEEKARQMGAECQAWMGVATSHEAVAAGLRATLDQLILQSPNHPAIGGGCEGEAEDAQSCCFAAPAEEDDGAAASRSKTAASCRSCGGGEARVLVLPCRHLCLCSACEAGVDACPVCAAAKNGSLHVLFS